MFGIKHSYTHIYTHSTYKKSTSLEVFPFYCFNLLNHGQYNLFFLTRFYKDRLFHVQQCQLYKKACGHEH